MKAIKLTYLFLLVVLSMTLSSCGGGGDGGSGGGSATAEVNTDNNSSNGDALKVIADAGPDQSGSIQIPITLDGSNSTTDSTGDITYKWTFISKPLGSVAILSADI